MDDGALDRARQDADLGLAELWVRYVALGGAADALELEAYLTGALALAAHEHNVIAQAINERFVELGGDHPVPYRDDRVVGSLVDLTVEEGLCRPWRHRLGGMRLLGELQFDRDPGSVVAVDGQPIGQLLDERQPHASPDLRTRSGTPDAAVPNRDGHPPLLVEVGFQFERARFIVVGVFGDVLHQFGDDLLQSIEFAGIHLIGTEPAAQRPATRRTARYRRIPTMSK